MSFTSTYGRWIETQGLADLFEADKPVATSRSIMLVNNLNHLRDISTQERVSHLTHVGETIAATDFGGSSVNAAPLLQYTIPWTILGAGKLARPVLRIGAYRNSAGTSYASAGLYPSGVRQDATGRGAVAYWPETSFTATTPTVVLEAAADVAWRGRRFPPNPQREGFVTFGGADPQNDGTIIPSRVDVLMLTLAIFIRHTGSSETRVSLVGLREFSGP